MTLMNLKPLRSTIYVKLEEPADTKGLVLSTTPTEPFARVVAVGPGTPMDVTMTLLKPSVKVGDKVLLLGKSIGKQFTYEGEQYQAIDEGMIIGVVEELPIQ